MNICTECGSRYPYHYLYCSSCGHPSERAKEIAVEEARRRKESAERKVTV